MSTAPSLLRDQFENTVYRNVVGFSHKYFPSLCDGRPELVVGHIRSPTGGSEDVSRWFQESFQARSGSAQKAEFAFGSLNSAMGRSVCLVRCESLSTKQTSAEASVLVLGLATDGPTTTPDGSALHQFFSVATKVFAKQPDRRFLHAFHVHNTLMEPWVFDKAGAFSGKPIEMSSDPDSALRVLNTYMVMSDADLGLNTLIKREGDRRFLELPAPNTSTSCRFEIEERPFVIQSDLVGEGTLCFKGRQTGATPRKVVIKFSWTSDKSPKEVILLQKATDAHVTGVPHLEAHHLIDHTAGLRYGLRFNLRHHFTDWPAPTMNDGEVSRPDVEDEWTPEYEDLYYRCVVVHPLGVPLESYKSTTELLEALRDAVKALRSLYFDANILHRDVSPGNIIISTEKRELDKPPTGLLIDLDMSLDLGETPAPGTLIGSQGYMAIGILGGDEHTYRHDLESLFYVFLWVAVCHDGQILGDAPSQSRLKQWLGNDWYTIWKTKEKDMQPENFLIWTNEEFAESFRCLLPLAIALHGLLFPLRDRLPFTGTDIKPNTIKKLYSDIIATFDKYLLLL